MKVFLSFLYFSLFFIQIISKSNWNYDHLCQYGKSTNELRKFIPSPQYMKEIYSCLPSELIEFPRPPPLNLRWSLEPGKNSKLWISISQRMKGKKLLFVGDSTMFQAMVGVAIYLESIGIKCHSNKLATGFLCSTGMEMLRPYAPKLNYNFTPAVIPMILNSDIAIVSVALHYTGMGCYNDKNSGLCDDTRQFFNVITSNITNNQTKVQIAWMDPFRPHFPARGGSYIEWKNSRFVNTSKITTCGKAQGPISYQGIPFLGSHTVAKYFPHIPIIHTYDMTFERDDIHLGILTHNDPKKLDCVHSCYQICFWEAISYRIGEVIDKLLKEKGL